MTAGTELEAVTGGQLALVRDKEWDLDKVAGELAAPLPEPSDQERQPFPALPKAVEITGALRGKIAILARNVGLGHLEDRRKLTPAELVSLSEEGELLSEVLGVLDKRREEIKEIVRVHMDVTAEESGVAVPVEQTGRGGGVIVEATARDRKGHYLLAAPEAPFEIPVTGFTRGWQQHFTSGKLTLSGSVLTDLYHSGKITREEYMACTESARVFSQDRMKAYIRKYPARGLAILKAIVKRGPANSSLDVPEAS